MIAWIGVCGVAALLAPLVLKPGRMGFLILSTIPLLAFAWLVSLGPAVMSGTPVVSHWSWIPELSLTVDFRLDTLSWVMALIVTGIGGLVLAYCTRYFSAAAPHLGRFAGVFLGFIGAMLGLVTTDTTLSLYVFWELTTVFSFLLIGHNSDLAGSRRAALQAITVTTAGGLAMLAGFVILGEMPGGSYSISTLVDRAQAGTLGVDLESGAQSSTLLTVAIVLVLIGAVTKSAQVPFHFWLPAAMAAPTPVSAYLHAAAMVKGGVYVVARFAPGFSHLPAWQILVVSTGCAAMILGGYRAVRQTDIKLILAFGTVSQLGFMMILVGYGTRQAMLAGLAVLTAHALFKSTLFLCVGLVDWASGTRDIRELSGMWRVMPLTAIASALAGASMMGLPLTAGFVAKETALDGFLATQGWMAAPTTVLVTLVVGSIFTAAYTLRFWWGAFWTKRGVIVRAVKPRSWVMLTPVLILAGGGAILPALTSAWDNVLSRHSALILGDGIDNPHLHLWAGLSPAFALTLAILAVGLLLFIVRDRWALFTARLTVPFSADGAYRALVAGLERFSTHTTRLTQRGSLPTYLLTIITFMILVAGSAAVFGGTAIPHEVCLWDSPAQALACVVTALAAIAAAHSRGRMKAVLLFGATGYGIALIYELYGAPDLALTQVLVETMTLVVFVLVLRRLPPYFSNRPLRVTRWARLAVAIAAGVFVAAVSGLAAGVRIATPISTHFADEGYNYGYGKNIVNVTLVDIRAWDTMGEISVLVVCAVGVSSLLFIRDRFGRIDRYRNLPALAGNVVRGDPNRPFPYSSRNRTWLAGSATLAASRRSVLLELGTRLIFHTMVIVSLYFLFAGHNQPGGGFAGGLLAGIALVLRYVAGGRYELGVAVPLHPGHLMGTGIVIATASALAPIVLGGTTLQTTVIDITLPGFGPVHFATALIFDIGVYLVVVGLALDVVRSLGAEIDRHGEIEGDVDDTTEIVPSDDERTQEVDAQHALISTKEGDAQ